MKLLEITGENYSGNWTKSRTGCRAVIIKDGMILISYETKNDQWMIPGGGLEENETDGTSITQINGDLSIGVTDETLSNVHIEGVYFYSYFSLFT